jgi:hypothetical protein
MLGRWCLKDKSKNYWKIDMANTDHCGTCTQEKVVTETIHGLPSRALTYDVVYPLKDR